MKSFKHIAKLVKQKRLAHPGKLSQSELSHKLGYKNGQFISNVERGLCSIPLKSLSTFCEILDIPKQELMDTMLKDLEVTLDRHLSNSHSSQSQSELAS
jgi:transcriptional regulator with XRE-family HTH domain